MAKNEHIVSFSADALAITEDRTDWARVDGKTDVDLAADIAADPAWTGVPEDWVNRAHWAFGTPGARRENKKQVTMRFDADVLDYFRGQGRGWQSRMNAVLRTFMMGDPRKPGK